jgi:hypothetical protein
MAWLPWLPVLTFHGPTLPGVSFASTSEVYTPAIFEWLKLRNQKVRCIDRFQWHGLHTEFNENRQIGSKVISIDSQTDKQHGNLITLTFLFKGM